MAAGTAGALVWGVPWLGSGGSILSVAVPAWAQRVVREVLLAFVERLAERLGGSASWAAGAAGVVPDAVAALVVRKVGRVVE